MLDILMMNKHISLFFIFLLLLGCSRTNGVRDSDLIASVLVAEAKLSKAYFSGDRDLAEAGLHEYIRLIDSIVAAHKLTPAVERTVFSGRSLALARLEILIAGKENRPVDLDIPIRDWRRFALIDGERPDDAQIRNILISTIRLDVPQAPWLANYEDIFKR